jgi:hypothetical protein
MGVGGSSGGFTENPRVGGSIPPLATIRSARPSSKFDGDQALVSRHPLRRPEIKAQPVRRMAATDPERVLGPLANIGSYMR